jgi:hypothetical protein
MFGDVEHEKGFVQLRIGSQVSGFANQQELGYRRRS